MSTPTQEPRLLSGEPEPGALTHHSSSDSDFPLLVIRESTTDMTTTVLSAVADIAAALVTDGLEFIRADGIDDGEAAIRSHPELAGVLIEPDREHLKATASLIRLIRSRSEMQGVTSGQDGSGHPYRGVYCVTGL